MNQFHVYVNAADFGIIEAESAQQAKDFAAQIAGYKSEFDMVTQLDSASEFQVILID